MTEKEFAALPVIEESVALFTDYRDGVFRDASGVWWLTGWLKGEHVRMLFDHPGAARAGGSP